MVFLSICPRDKQYLECAVKDIPLRVVLDDGVELAPDVQVNVTDLNKRYKHFKIDSGKGNELKVTVLVRRNDTITGKVLNPVVDMDDFLPNEDFVDEDPFDSTVNVTADYNIVRNYYGYEKVSVYSMLNYFYRHGTPLFVRCKELGLDDSKVWLITENKSRKYERGGWFYWDLTFTQYVKVKYTSFTKTNKGIQKALKKAKSKKSKKVSAATKLRKALSKCNVKVLVYSKKKKTVSCVKTLQKLLNQYTGSKLVIHGWFGKETVKAVKKFQNKYSKSYGLKPTGKVNTATYNVMIGKAKKVTKKTTKKTTAKKTTKKKVHSNGQIGDTITIKQGSTKGILR